jgi:hypothetical protein
MRCFFVQSSCAYIRLVHHYNSFVNPCNGQLLKAINHKSKSEQSYSKNPYYLPFEKDVLVFLYLEDPRKILKKEKKIKS